MAYQCPRCNGSGTVTVTVTVTNWSTQQQTTQNKKETCDRCGGSGEVR